MPDAVVRKLVNRHSRVGGNLVCFNEQSLNRGAKDDAIQPAVYVLASNQNGATYIVVTGNLVQRIWQHRNESTQGVTQKYRVHRLVYYYIYNEMSEAIQREKRLKSGIDVGQ